MVSCITSSEKQKFFAINNLIKEQNIDYLLSEVTLIPKTTVDMEGKKAMQMLNLMEQLEDHDDVQKVYANFNIADEIMEEISASKDQE